MKKSWKGWLFTGVVFITATVFVALKFDIPTNYVTIIAVLEGGITGTGIAKSLKS